MQSLLTQLTHLPKTGRILRADKQCCLLELIKRAGDIRLQNPQLFESKVGLQYTNLFDFVAGLIAFDGWCSAIYLCPPNVDPSQKGLESWPPKNNPIVDGLPKTLQQPATSDLVSTTWYMATSGTTGEPKWYSHSFDSLTTSTKYSNKLQKLCWALLYQPFRFAGLQVILQALLSGADLVDGVDYEPIALTSLLKKTDVTALSATPSLWRQLLMTGQLSELNLGYITLGGEIADQSVLDKLNRLFPDAKLRHIYASTETGVGLVVSDRLAGFPIQWLEDLTLPIALKISDEHHLLVKPSHQICQNLAKQTDTLGYVDTQDLVEVKDDRVLFIGRSTGVINVGGNKVYPEKIEQVILQNPDINQARVYAKKSALMGELVVADITIIHTDDHKQLKQQVLKLCKNQLQRFEIPTKINVVNDIAHDPSGKLNRHINRKPNGKQKHD